MSATATAGRVKELMLRPPALTLAAAESITCGRVQAAIAAVSGASNYFRGGVTAYTLDAKVQHLGVNRAAAKKVDCVSAAVAEEMARGVSALFDCDVGVATTGYAEPVPARQIAAPFAWWALAHRRRGKFIAVRSGRIECPGAKRVEAQAIVAEAVLAELVAYLEMFRG
jgi:nicotinamide-nucleotide amidase